MWSSLFRTHREAVECLEQSALHVIAKHVEGTLLPAENEGSNVVIREACFNEFPVRCPLWLIPNTLISCSCDKLSTLHPWPRHFSGSLAALHAHFLLLHVLHLFSKVSYADNLVIVTFCASCYRCACAGAHAVSICSTFIEKPERISMQGLQPDGKGTRPRPGVTNHVETNGPDHGVHYHGR